MLESLPESAQEHILEKLSELVEELRDDIRWSTLFKEHEIGLTKKAEKALKEFNAGKSQAIDFSKL